MPLSTPAPRRHMHTRRIHAEGFLREDGLWDIEASIVDTKTYRYEEPFRGERNAGDPVHDMTVRLTLDAQMTVQAIEVDMPSTPYAECTTVRPAFQGLVGKRIGAGWRQAVQAAVGREMGCTHVRELLFPMATVAFQTLGGWREKKAAAKPPLPGETEKRPYFIGGCKAWAESGEVVATLYPKWHRPIAKP
ncbi:MAG: DUF2889 domain-containing protein [Proteobacteria bacterium]|nr:DUF2889 domain-containing protein [Pseudomonadota bacterium]